MFKSSEINRIEVALAIEKALEVNHKKLQLNLLSQHKMQEMHEDCELGSATSDSELNHQEVKIPFLYQRN